MAWSPTLAPSIEVDLVVDEAVTVVGLARLAPGLHAGERLVTPLGELAGGDAELAAEGVGRLAAEDAEDDLGLAAAGPTSAVGGIVLAVAFGGFGRSALTSPPKASCIVASSWCRALCPRVPDGCLRKPCSAPLRP
jgi:hypothetical protein